MSVLQLDAKSRVYFNDERKENSASPSDAVSHTSSTCKAAGSLNAEAYDLDRQMAKLPLTVAIQSAFLRGVPTRSTTNSNALSLS